LTVGEACSLIVPERCIRDMEEREGTLGATTFPAQETMDPVYGPDGGFRAGNDAAASETLIVGAAGIHKIAVPSFDAESTGSVLVTLRPASR